MKTLLLLALTASSVLATPPTIATPGIENAASYSNPGFPNGSIAQGSLFVVFGSALGPAAIQYATSFPLPSTLSGTSINVTVNGTTLPCPMIYTSDGQLAAILPSAIPTGTGTLVVSYNGATHAAPINVVTSSPGIFTVNQQGNGVAVIQDGSGQPNASNYAFNPGETVVIWGTGLGPISGSDADVPPTGNLPGITVAAYVGGQPAAVVYAGRSQDAGVDQINITLPPGVTGCYVPVYIVATPNNGTPVTSNFGTLAIAGSGTLCVDPNFPDISSGTGYSSGMVSLTRLVSIANVAGQTTTATSDSGVATFYEYTSSNGFVDATNGSCTVVQNNGGAANQTPNGLDAGARLNVSGPNGAKQMPKSASGLYGATFAMSPPLYLVPGSYNIDNGNGGADVGDFQLSLTFPPVFTWTNENSITTVDRSQPLQITWAGGDPNGQVQVSGRSDAGMGTYVMFTCYDKASALQLSIPQAILSLLPASGTASFTVSGLTEVSGAASGLDTLTGAAIYSSQATGITVK